MEELTVSVTDTNNLDYQLVEKSDDQRYDNDISNDDFYEEQPQNFGHEQLEEETTYAYDDNALETENYNALSDHDIGQDIGDISTNDISEAMLGEPKATTTSCADTDQVTSHDVVNRKDNSSANIFVEITSNKTDSECISSAGNTTGRSNVSSTQWKRAVSCGLSAKARHRHHNFLNKLSICMKR